MPAKYTTAKIQPSGVGSQGSVVTSPRNDDYQGMKPECPTIPGLPYFPPTTPGDPYPPDHPPSIPQDPDDDDSSGKCPELEEELEEKCKEIEDLKAELEKCQEEVQDWRDAEQDREMATGIDETGAAEPAPTLPPLDVETPTLDSHDFNAPIEWPS